MTICDRCNEQITFGEGFAVWSEMKCVMNPTGKMEYGICAKGTILAGETGGMLLCDKCANGVFTEETYKAASEKSIVVEDDSNMVLAKKAQLLANNYAICMRAKRRGLTLEQAKAEARDIRKTKLDRPERSDKTIKSTAGHWHTERKRGRTGI
jgi:hypothetical protein